MSLGVTGGLGLPKRDLQEVLRGKGGGEASGSLSLNRQLF